MNPRFFSSESYGTQYTFINYRAIDGCCKNLAIATDNHAGCEKSAHSATIKA